MWLALYLHLQVVVGLPQYCSDRKWYGCYTQGQDVAYMAAGLTSRQKDFVVAHESGHYCGIMDETVASEWADFWLGRGNETANSKWDQFLVIITECHKQHAGSK